MNYNIIHYACIIDTSTTETMESIGLYNGKIKIISDGCTLTPNAYFEDTTPVGDNWVNLFKLEGLAQTGTRIDITTGGDYAYLTGMNITLANQTLDGTMPYHEALQQLQQSWLIGAGIQFFVVCDRERFIQRWEGVVDNIAFTDEDFTFSAVDKLVKKFKQLPQVAGDQIAIGDVKYVPLKITTTATEEKVLLESHTVARIVPYNDDYCDGVYAKETIWRADDDVDKVGFGCNSQYPSLFSDAALLNGQRRVLTPINNRDYWVLIEVEVDHPEWVGKTATVMDKDYSIIGTYLGYPPNTDSNVGYSKVLWIMLKDFDATITSEALFGIPKAIRYADQCLNVTDAVALLDSLQAYNSESLTVTISDKAKVLQYSVDGDASEIATDDNGTIIFYTKGADGVLTPITVEYTIDANNNIVISNESKRRELVLPRTVTLDTTSTVRGYPATFNQTTFEPIYTPVKGAYYQDKSFFDGKDYDIRQLTNGRVLDSSWTGAPAKHIYAKNYSNGWVGNNPIKLLLEFDSLNTDQEYKPFLFMQSDFYESEQWASTYESYAFAHGPALLGEYYESTDLSHREENNTATNVFFRDGTPTHRYNALSVASDMWVVDIYPVTVSDTYGLLTPFSLDSEFKPVVPYTFDLPKRANRSPVNQINIDVDSSGANSKRYVWQGTMTYPVCTAPIDLIPNNTSVGVPISISFYEWHSASPSEDLVKEFKGHTLTTDIIRIGTAHAEYLQTATAFGNELQWVLNSVATGSTPKINSEIPTISADDIKIATNNGITRLLFEIRPEYFNDHALRILGEQFAFVVETTTLMDISPEVLKVMGIGLMVDEPINLGELYVTVVPKSGLLTIDTNTIYGSLYYLTNTYSGLIGNYGNLYSKRYTFSPNIWNVGRLIQDQKNTFDYITEICQQSFVTGWTNRMGDLTYAVLSPEFETTDSDNNLVYFTESNIIRDSLSSLSLTPLTQVYNEFDIQFAYSYVTGKYDKQYSVKHVDADMFPPGDANWQEFVIGIDDYLMAKDVWVQCHAGWLENKTINKAPTNVTDLIWATDFTMLGSDLASPYEEYAYQYLMLMAKWATRQKWMVEFDVPVNEFNAKLELMQRVRFHDTVLTPDIVVEGIPVFQYGVGYITSLSVVPNDDVIKLGLTFEKFGSRARVPVQDVIITETGTAITITETGTAITITE